MLTTLDVKNVKRPMLGIIAGTVMMLCWVGVAAGASGIGQSPVRGKSTSKSISTSVSFIIESNQGEPISGAQINLGSASGQICLTAENGRCSVIGYNSTPGTDIPFHIIASGFETAVGSLSAEEVRVGHVLILIHLTPSVPLQTSFPKTAGSSQRTSASVPASPPSQEPFRQSSKFSQPERQPSVLFMVILLLILVTAIAGAAVWTKYAVTRTFRTQRASSNRDRDPALMNHRAFGDDLNRLIETIYKQQAKLPETLASIDRDLNALFAWAQASARLAPQVEMAAGLSERRSAWRRIPSQESTRPEVQTAPPTGTSFKLDWNDETERLPRNKTHARDAYRRVLQNPSLLSKVIFANRETASSPINMFQKGPVSLVEVDARNGSFILFKDHEGVRAWVFPNPIFIFRKEVFNPLFPNLDQSTFDNCKRDIDPVEVSAAGEKRWTIVVP